MHVMYVPKLSGTMIIDREAPIRGHLYACSWIGASAPSWPAHIRRTSYPADGPAYSCSFDSSILKLEGDVVSALLHVGA